jgi:hypothetical protein
MAVVECLVAGSVEIAYTLVATDVGRFGLTDVELQASEGEVARPAVGAVDGGRHHPSVFADFAVHT